MRKILAVCLGNYCRSPFAQVALARRGSSTMTVRSAGLIGKWQDKPAHPQMIEAARRLGHDLTIHRGQQLTMHMVDWADTVLAMDQAVLGALRALRADEDSPKFRLYLGSADVPDPMGKDSDAFNDCAVLIEAGTALHLGHGPG